MSSQGGASNANGRSLEDKVELLLAETGTPYEKQQTRWPGLNPSGHKHDFVALIGSQWTVIECKSFSGMPGSIWEKLPYAILVLASHNIPGIMVLGGHVPNDWRRGFLVGLGAQHHVAVWTLEQLESHLRAQNRRQPAQSVQRGDGPVPNGQAMDAGAAGQGSFSWDGVGAGRR